MRIVALPKPRGTMMSQVGPDLYPIEFIVFIKNGQTTTLEAYSTGDGYCHLDLVAAALTPPEITNR